MSHATKFAPQLRPTLSELDIRLELSGSRGRYVVPVEGGEAELTLSIASPTLRIADHTSVPDNVRGTGVGRALVQRLVDDARAEGFKVVPLCPYVNAERRRHSEWADVFST